MNLYVYCRSAIFLSTSELHFFHLKDNASESVVSIGPFSASSGTPGYSKKEVLDAVPRPKKKHSFPQHHQAPEKKIGCDVYDIDT